MIAHERHDLREVPAAAYVLAGALVLILGLAVFAASRPAVALPAYAQQTGLACGRCHVNPAGGGPRTAFGNAFAANGHKLPSASKEPSKKTAGGAAPPPASGTPFSPPTGAEFLSDSDYAQAQAWSLRRPYYSHFLYQQGGQ